MDCLQFWDVHILPRLVQCWTIWLSIGRGLETLQWYTASTMEETSWIYRPLTTKVVQVCSTVSYCLETPPWGWIGSAWAMKTATFALLVAIKGATGQRSSWILQVTRSASIPRVYNGRAHIQNSLSPQDTISSKFLRFWKANKSPSLVYTRTECVLAPDTVTYDEEAWWCHLQRRMDCVKLGNLLFSWFCLWSFTAAWSRFPYSQT